MTLTERLDIKQLLMSRFWAQFFKDADDIAENYFIHETVPKNIQFLINWKTIETTLNTPQVGLWNILLQERQKRLFHDDFLIFHTTHVACVH